MNLILTVVTVLGLWQISSCFAKEQGIMANPEVVTVTEHVSFDIRVNNYHGPKEHLDGRVVIAVFGDLLPMTALNFVSIARGYMRGKDFLTYNNTLIHRIVPDFIVQMGDIQNLFGKGGTCIYGDKFRDEGYAISHSSSGIVSMANSGKDTNNSQFFITLQPARFLDRKHVAFGKVIAGMEFVKQIASLPTLPNQSPKNRIAIVRSAVEGLETKYKMSDEQLDTNSDELREEDFIVHDDEFQN